MEIEELEGIAGTDLIQETFLFQLFDFEETLAMARLFKRETKKPGEAIIEEGALGQALYMIEKGKVKVIKEENGHQELLATLGNGELFGEMSLIENELTSASVVAETATTLLVIRRPDFEKLLEENISIAFKVYKAFCLTLSDRLRRTSEELGRLKAGLEKGGKKSPARPAQKPAAKGKKAKPAKGKVTGGKKGRK